jgi:phenylacetate-CoA ligase
MWNHELEAMPRGELRGLQFDRLKTLLSRALDDVSFYRKTYGVLGITAEDIQHLSDLRKLPFLTKSDLRDHYPLGMLAVDRSQLRRIHISSGTRGKPTVSAYTQKDVELWSDLCARSLVAAGVRPGDVVHNAYGYGLFTGGLGIHYGAERLGAAVVPISGGRTQQQIMLLDDFRADVMCCTPSYAMNVALALEEAHVPLHRMNLRLGIFGAEPWSEELRQQLEQKLKVKAIDIYGLSEILGPGVAIECIEARDGLHIWEDQFIVEIIDPQSGEPVEDGAAGELVITTLTKEALPLIRYRTGDVTSVNRQPCRCGRTHARIKRLKGRLDDMLIVRGVNVYPSEIENLLLAIPALSSQYQIVISRDKALDDIKVRVEAESATPAELVSDVISALKECLGITASVEILPLGSLPRSEGKALRVLDLRDEVS